MTTFRKRWIAWGLLALWLATGLWNTIKPMPPGTVVHSPAVVSSSSAIRFLADRSYLDIHGKEFHEQQIFDEIFNVIDQAQSFVVADYFLFNDLMGAASAPHRRLSSELAQHLIARKLVRPGLTVLIITDPINEVYGGAHSQLLDELRAAGVDVVSTDLNALRDSNPAWSSLWRLFIQWWGNTPDHGTMPNPFDAGPDRITLRSWFTLVNFKANHRKVVVADQADGNLTAVVASANPHDASSAHSNVALRIEGDIARQMLASELAIARFSHWRGRVYTPEPLPSVPAAASDAAEVSWLTESAIRDHLLQALDRTRNGDVVRIGMFYLSDRKVIDALVAAAERGVTVRLILDPNKDAFGRQKDGVPNRPVANELMTRGKGKIDVRWYRTHGEQFHTKLVLIARSDALIASLGSANLTRRNLADYNLEANIGLQLPLNAPLAAQMIGYFDDLWGNVQRGDQSGAPQYTAPFGAYEDTDGPRYWRYRIMEATGLSTF